MLRIVFYYLFHTVKVATVAVLILAIFITVSINIIH
jgi:hypothetical protein